MHGSHAKANKHASNQHMNRWRLPRSLQVIVTAHHARARMITSHGWTHTHVEHHPHTNVRLHTCAYTHARALEPTSLFELCQPSVYLSPASLAEDTFNTSSPSDAFLNPAHILLYLSMSIS